MRKTSLSLQQSRAATITNNSLAIEATDVCFTYPGRDTAVLNGINLSMSAGSVLCLMGVNGCGKSTFLDCVLGNNRFTSGSLKVMGNEVAKLKVQQLARLVAYVPQEHHHTFPYNVQHVVQMGRTVYLSGLGTPDSCDCQRIQDAMQLCGIEHLAQRPYTSLSGGEMQMTLLARALVQDAPIIIMDEPTVHLDFRNELIFLETLTQLLKDRQLSVLMATHSPNQAFYLENAGLDVQIALMDQGRIHTVNAPKQVLTPQCLRQLFGIEALVMEQEYSLPSHQGQVTQIASIAISNQSE